MFRRSTPIWIYDKNEELQLILEPNSDNVEGIPHYDSWFTEQLNGAITLEFTVPADNPKVAAIEMDGRAVIRDRDGNLVEFIIRKPQDRNGMNGPEKYVFAEGGDYELIDEWMTGYKADNVTLKNSLEAILSSTRWSVGVVDDFGTQSVNLEPTTVKNALIQLLNIYGGQVRYRIEADGNRIVRRYIDVLRKRGEFRGKRFETGKDVITNVYTPDSTQIKTALYGYGAGGENDGPRLTFADVEWSKANGDPVDKPLGQTWIGDPEALQKWGYDGGTRHRFGKYSGQEEDPAELLLNTWKSLQTLVNPIRTYEFQVVLLEDLPGYEHELVRLGDTVLCLDRDIYPHMEAEADIIEYRQNLNDSRYDEVVVGDFKAVFDTAGRVANTENIIDNKQGNWDKKETPEGAQQKAENEAQKAIDEAQSRIDAAKAEIENAIIEIENTKIDLENAQALIDDTLANPQNYSGEFVGDLIADSLIVRGPIISENATITGTIQSSQATFLNATIDSATIIDADIQNATITGTLASVDGTFTGDLVGARILSNTTIDVTTDLYVGDNIYLGSLQDLGFTKSIVFTSNSTISGVGDILRLSSMRTDITHGNVNLGSPSYETRVMGDLIVYGTIDGTVSNATNASYLGGYTAASFALANHNHHGTYARVVGSTDIWFESTPNGIDVYKNGTYAGYIRLQGG